MTARSQANTDSCFGVRQIPSDWEKRGIEKLKTPVPAAPREKRTYRVYQRHLQSTSLFVHKEPMTLSNQQEADKARCYHSLTCRHLIKNQNAAPEKQHKRTYDVKPSHPSSKPPPLLRNPQFNSLTSRTEIRSAIVFPPIHIYRSMISRS